MPVSLALLGVGLVGKGISAYNSNQQEKKLRKQLAEQQKTPYQRYSVAPQIQNAYSQAYGESSAPRGYTGAQTGSFRAQLGQMLSSRFGAATNASTGSSGKAINSILGGQETQAINQFAANDPTEMNRRAALGRMGQYAGQFQRTQDQNTNFDQQYKLQTERALGSSIASQRNYRQNLMSGAAGQLLGVGGQLLGQSQYLDAMGKQGTDPNSPPLFNRRTARQQASLYNFDQ